MKKMRSPITESVISLSGDYLLSIDPENIGREQRWFVKPSTDAKMTKAPVTIQQIYPNYHGVAWYWHSFIPKIKFHNEGRCLLHFYAVDYLAEVWLNGVYVGMHEGGETPFKLDVTNAIKQDSENLLAIRVLNPTNEPIDDIILKQTPHRNKVVPYTTGGSYNHGGIMQPVELIHTSAVRVADIFSKADAKSGKIKLQVTVRNDTEKTITGFLTALVAPAVSGGIIENVSDPQEFPKGDSLHNIELCLSEPHLWDLDDPYLYRATVGLDSDEYSHEQSIRFGFRDFSFHDGHFYLNNRRIFLRSAHTGNHYPIGMQLPHDLELLRRDLYYAKVAGFNMVRFIAGLSWQSQLDFCDELGLMVYEESYAGWCLENSPKMAERFDKSTSEMVLRDRNHPSVTIWGLLNETFDGAVFRHAVNSLSLVRSLDDTRMVLLGSGRWDGIWSIGSISNPESNEWEHLLGAEDPNAPKGEGWTGGYIGQAGDAHYYPAIPLSADSIKFFRELGSDTKSIFLSEHGDGGEVDAVRVVRLYEQQGISDKLEDYVLYKSEADKFLADWERFGMDSMFADQSDFMQQSQKINAEQRLVGLNAIRSNPKICGYSITGLCDQGMTAEGLWTTFRELKPSMLESIRDGFAPLRWCIFAEPVHGYKGQTFRLEAVLANEDVLLPGDYPVRFKVIGPNGVILDIEKTLKVSDKEQAIVLPVICEDLTINSSAGRYEIVAYFEKGGAPVGGRSHFFVSDPVNSSDFVESVTIWGDEEKLGSWLDGKGISYRNFADAEPNSREIILVGGSNGLPDDIEKFQSLARRIYQGGNAVFLTPQALKRGENPLGWLPLINKGEIRQTQGWAAGRDDFAKAHPIFNGMPSNGLLDLTFYRDLIPGQTFNGQDAPSELVAGSFAVGSYQPQGYYSGMLVAVYQFGAGRFIINSMRIFDNLDKHPAADYILMNCLRYASTDISKPLAELPDDFDNQLKIIGY